MDSGVLRFITAGSVDDGKSTLIGRLLFDSKNIFADQMASLQRAKHKRTEGDQLDLSLLTDGLEAEREQGITIDVAYRYFATSKRKFIIADAPGHEQYTRNMMTGASTADAMIVLIDAVKALAQNRILVQTKRHTTIASLLKVRHILVAVNKMDLLKYDQAVFQKIADQYIAFAKELGLSNISVTPVSALHGDNIVEKSANMSWYQGLPLLSQLENLETHMAPASLPFRFPVQWVSRTNGDSVKDFRGYMGRVESGVVAKGDTLTVLPSGQKIHVKDIITLDGSLKTAERGQSVTLIFEEHSDVSRGDLLAGVNSPPSLVKTFDADVCWLTESPSSLKHSYWLKFTTKQTSAKIIEIESLLDINTLEKKPAAELKLNDIGRIKISVRDPLPVDTYEKNPATGSFILIDEVTHETAAAGMIR